MRLDSLRRATSIAGAVAILATMSVVAASPAHADVGIQTSGMTRLVDTRSGIGVEKRRLRAGESIRIPNRTNASTTVGNFLNVAVVQPSADGYLTVYACVTSGNHELPRPETSNVNYVRGQTTANFVTVWSQAGGSSCLYTNQETDVIVDNSGVITGFRSELMQLSTPTRILDTRTGLQPNGTTTNGSVLTLQVSGNAGVPNPFTSLDSRTIVSSVVFNLTATGSNLAGYVSVYDCGSLRPNASNINFAAGETSANQVLTRLGAAGNVCLYSSTPVQLIVDINGYTLPYMGPRDGPFPADYTTNGFLRFQEVVPRRLYDTRGSGFAKVTAGETIRVPVATNAMGSALTITAVDPEAEGYLTIFDCDRSRPNASNLNFRTGVNVANHAMTKLARDGNVCIYSSAKTNILVDLNSLFN